ncbi:exported hypothetical protein [metagenome]|uniref:Lipoprotein n=1 Tax=metagenome TaxID=256318 RepID=A0A2P2CD06_9ZZZZ
MTCRRPLIPSQGAGLTAVLLLAASALSGCTSSAHEQETAWQALHRYGWPDETAVVIYWSQSLDNGRDGLLEFAAADGSELDSAPISGLDNGRMREAGNSAVCILTSDGLMRISRTTATKTEVPDSAHSVGHWVGTDTHGSCVGVYNSGAQDSGYVTSVGWATATGQGRGESVVPDVPGPVGSSSQSVWVRNAGTPTTRGTVTLYRVDMETGRTTVSLRWTTGTIPVGSGAVSLEAGYASDIFADHGKLYYLEDLKGVDAEGGWAELEPGVHAELRLAELDPNKRSHRSRLVAREPWGSTEGSDGKTSLLATALWKGHLFGRAIYSGDGEGHLVRVDLDTAQRSVVGTLSEEAKGADSINAAWDQDSLHLLLETAGTFTLETYSLVSGSLRDSIPVDEPHEGTSSMGVQAFAVVGKRG